MYGVEQIRSKIKIFKFRVARCENSEPVLTSRRTRSTWEEDTWSTGLLHDNHLIFCLHGDVVGLVPRLGSRLPKNQISIHDTGKRLSSPNVSDCIWSQSSPIFNGYWNRILGGEGGHGVKTITYLDLVPMLQMCGALLPLRHMSSLCRDNFNFAFNRSNFVFNITFCPH